MRGIVFANWINEIPGENPIGAEVGVGSGNTSQTLLKTVPGIFLSLIDPWKTLPGGLDWDDGIHRDRYETALESTRPWENQREMIAQPSLEAVKKFSDKSLDFVLLDADHRPESVYDDCEAWWPKIKEGGFLGGRHYLRRINGKNRGLEGVKLGVDQFAEEFWFNLILVGVSWKFLKG